MNKKLIASAVAALAAFAATAEVMDRPQGVKIGQRMTLRPYVSLSYTYDSNVDSTKHSKAGSQWVVSPGLTVDYLAENWKVVGNVYYQYHAYNKYVNQLNSSSYGESLQFDWTNSKPEEAGWRAMFSERFQQVAQDDDMSNHGGRGVGRDRKEFTANGVLERRLNDYWHASTLASYYYLDYDNNVNKYAQLYGWRRTVLGAEAGYAPTKWTDFIVQANYQWYDQDNSEHRPTKAVGRNIDSDSRGVSVMGGIASHATEKITYRAMGGWSRFEYGGGAKTCNGFTYQLSSQWKVDNTLSLMLLGSSYYQPSERYYGTANKVYTVSAGAAKSWVRGKLTTGVDLAYRRESTEYTQIADADYDEDIWTGRFNVNYTINRFVSVFGSIEYQNEKSRGSTIRNNIYDYDRFRGTIGLRLTY